MKIVIPKSLQSNVCRYITTLPAFPCSEIVYFSFALYVFESVGFFGFFVLSTLLWANFKFQVSNGFLSTGIRAITLFNPLKNVRGGLKIIYNFCFL